MSPYRQNAATPRKPWPKTPRLRLLAVWLREAWLRAHDVNHVSVFDRWREREWERRVRRAVEESRKERLLLDTARAVLAMNMRLPTFNFPPMTDAVVFKVSIASTTFKAKK